MKRLPTAYKRVVIKPSALTHRACSVIAGYRNLRQGFKLQIGQALDLVPALHLVLGGQYAHARRPLLDLDWPPYGLENRAGRIRSHHLSR